MAAISVLKGTKYACNLKFEMGHICLQSFWIGNKYACNVGNHYGVTLSWFFNESRENEFSMIASIFGPDWKRLQAYVAHFEFEIAGIFSPLENRDYSHIKSIWLLSLHAYLVPLIEIIAIISGSALYLKIYIFFWKFSSRFSKKKTILELHVVRDYPMDLVNRQQFFVFVHSNTKVIMLNHVTRKQYNNHHQYMFQSEIVVLSVLHDQKQLFHVS